MIDRPCSCMPNQRPITPGASLVGVNIHLHSLSRFPQAYCIKIPTSSKGFILFVKYISRVDQICIISSKSGAAVAPEISPALSRWAPFLLGNGSGLDSSEQLSNRCSLCGNNQCHSRLWVTPLLLVYCSLSHSWYKYAIPCALRTRLN